MNVTLTPSLEKFVRGKVESGDFRSAEEVITEGLRLLQQQDEQWANQAKVKIDEGWTQSKAGHLRSPELVRENLAARKADWKAGRGAA